MHPRTQIASPCRFFQRGAHSGRMHLSSTKCQGVENPKFCYALSAISDAWIYNMGEKIAKIPVGFLLSRRVIYWLTPRLFPYSVGPIQEGRLYYWLLVCAKAQSLTIFSLNVWTFNDLRIHYPEHYLQTWGLGDEKGRSLLSPSLD